MPRLPARTPAKEVLSLRLRQLMGRMFAKNPPDAGTIRAQLKVIRIYAAVNRLSLPDDLVIDADELKQAPPKVEPEPKAEVPAAPIAAVFDDIFAPTNGEKE